MQTNLFIVIVIASVIVLACIICAFCLWCYNRKVKNVNQINSDSKYGGTKNPDTTALEILRTSHDEFNPYEQENGVNHFQAVKVTPMTNKKHQVANLAPNKTPSMMIEKSDAEAKSG